MCRDEVLGVGSALRAGDDDLHYEGPQAHDGRLEAQRAYSRRQYMFKHEGAVRRNLSAATLALFYLRRSMGWRSDDAPR